MQLFNADCLDVLPTLEANSVDTIITDPPYGFSFMGKDWDRGVPGERFWTEALRVAKPGAILLAFGGTRTHHRLMCAIEDAGWEIRDCMMWLYGSGFPKSKAIDKAIDEAKGAKREVIRARTYELANAGGYSGGLNTTKPRSESCEITAPATPLAAQWHGWGTALKPAYEPIIVAQKPLDGTYAANAERWGVAGLWIDGGRIPANGDVMRRANNVTIGGNGIYGGGKPCETGAADGRRWPANLILDEDAAAALDVMSGERKSGARTDKGNRQRQSGFAMTGGNCEASAGGASRFFKVIPTEEPTRALYCAKASRRERNYGLEGMEERVRNITQGHGMGPVNTSKKSGGGIRENRPTANVHPTVKPLTLMRYLCRLTKTPTGGVVLDMFAGSGTTGMAALLEGREFIGIEADTELGYFEIMTRRIAAVQRDIEAEQSKPRQYALNEAAT